MAGFFFNALVAAAAAKKADPDFTIDLAITADDLTFGVTPYWNAGGWCSILDWGDGSTQAATTSNTQLTHTYAEAGSYRVRVRGDMYRFRVGSTNPAAVIDCNGNWDALGTLTSGLQMFMNCGNAAFTIRRLPDTLRSCGFLFYQCSQSDITLESLPASLSAGNYMFFLCFMASFDINSLANKVGSWDNVVNIENMFRRAGESTGTVTGHIASFMRKLPNVNSVAQSFQDTNTTTFGASDYFEITLTTTEANQVWGFTATSSAGRWYCFDWGDGTAVTANKNIDVFTSGTKVTHTFATPGTYHIKLATAPCQIVFDQYDSDNGNWKALGQ